MAALAWQVFATNDKPLLNPAQPGQVDQTNKPTGSAPLTTPSNERQQPAFEASETRAQQNGRTVVTTPDKLAVEAYANQNGWQIVSSTTLMSGETLLTIDQAADSPAVTQLAQVAPGTEVSQNYLVKPTFTPNDPRYTDQWALPKISAASAWDISTGNSSTVIAVIDSGIMFAQTIGVTTTTHDDFPNSKLWVNTGENCGSTDPTIVCVQRTDTLDNDGNGRVDDWQGWDFMGGFAGGVNCPNGSGGGYVAGDNDPTPYSCDDPSSTSQLNRNDPDADVIGHGTAVASVAAAATDNAKLIAGLNINAKLMNLRIFDGYGFGYLDDVVAAVDYATAKGANVINMSLAFSDCSSGFSISVLETAIVNAKARGIIVVGAAGNEAQTSPGNVCYPASSPNALAAGASDINDNRASWSNFGPELDVVAPGFNVLADDAPSASNSNSTANYTSGTSFAAPYVAGLAALLRGLAPASSADDIARFITAETDKLPGMSGASKTDLYGYGRINTWRSLKYATIAHPDGTLVKHPHGPAIFFIEDSQLYYVPQAEIYFSRWGNVDARVKTITPTDFSFAAGGEVSWQEGTILKGSGPAIYALEKKIGGGLTKRQIGSPIAYQQLGYSDSDRLNISDGLLNAIATDSDVTENDRHPYGTLVRGSGQQAIYLIDAGQKRYVPQATILESLNKGKFKVFTATTADLSLPNGPQVEFAEGTLVRDLSNQAIYVIDHNGPVARKRHILSPTAFSQLGYSESDIINAPSDHLPITNGPAVD